MIKITDCPHRFLGRVTIELKSPLHVGAGREWMASDAGVLLDANGLPAIPGSAIAGVLRQACELRWNDSDRVNALFGYQTREDVADPASPGIGQGSRLTVSWAAIHGADDRPRDRLLEPGSNHGWADSVLANALRPTLRDHVRLDGRGVAAKRGKFDELVVCAGHRFTFEMELIGGDDDVSDWNRLLGLLAHPLTRLGGKSRRGFGRFEVERAVERVFDLTQRPDFDAYVAFDNQLGSERDHPEDWRDVTSTLKATPVGDAAGEVLTVSLTARHFWMFGGGEDSDADLAPVRDAVIRWDHNGGRVEEGVFYLPGSAVKGALRHRALFHAYALCGHFADRPNPVGDARANRLVENLFGSAPFTGQSEEDDDGDQADSGGLGRLFVDDLFLESPPAVIRDAMRLQHHVSIDRFTGGGSDGHLFNEKPLYGGEMTLSLRVAPPAMAGDPGMSTDARRALDLALADLRAGRLALGGGAGRGHGFFSASLVS